MSITVVVQICSVILYYICQYMRFSNCIGHTTNNNAITAPKYIILRSSVFCTSVLIIQINSYSSILGFIYSITHFFLD